MPRRCFRGLGDRTIAWELSADGSTVVGWVNPVSPGTPSAFRWTEAGGLESLGSLSGHGRSVSDDGSIIVGHDSATAWRWTQGGGVAPLDSLPGGGVTAAFAISGDGSTVVGEARNRHRTGTEKPDCLRSVATPLGASLKRPVREEQL